MRLMRRRNRLVSRYSNQIVRAHTYSPCRSHPGDGDSRKVRVSVRNASLNLCDCAKTKHTAKVNTPNLTTSAGHALIPLVKLNGSPSARAKVSFHITTTIQTAAIANSTVPAQKQTSRRHRKRNV